MFYTFFIRVPHISKVYKHKHYNSSFIRNGKHNGCYGPAQFTQQKIHKLPFEGQSTTKQFHYLRPQLHDTGFASERHHILLLQGEFGIYNYDNII